MTININKAFAEPAGVAFRDQFYGRTDEAC